MRWQLASMALVLAALAAGLLWYERGRPSSKLLALVAALAAMAVAGRVLFAPIPNVQATTDVVLFSGYALGAGPGFAVGAVGALVSNFFLGQGPWTPWQMLGWGVVGLAGAGLARATLAPRRLWLALACALAGLAFGAWMDLFTLLSFAAERSGGTYLAIAATSLPFNIAHAAGNALLALLLGPAFVRLLTRFRHRFEVKWMPLPAPGRAGVTGAGGVAVAALVLALLPALALPERAQAASAALRAAHYLERAQNTDGGFGAAPHQRSSQLMTAWAAIGLEASGRRPFDVRRGGHSPIDFMRQRARDLRDTGELERTILALRGAGLSARRFGGRDLLAELARRRRGNGSFDGQVNLTAFGILALRAAGRSAGSAPIERAVSWLSRQQNVDGGFSFSVRRGTSDVDDTGAALQALSAAGRRHSAIVRRVLSYLRRQQNSDGGFGQLRGSRSNAQSTAWAVQGLVAAGTDPGRFGRKRTRSPLRYLRSLQQADGSFRYSRTSAQTPVWVTAQALAAVLRKPLPLRLLRRRL
jgi:energy-coupling factor transport system substrate-specific component